MDIAGDGARLEERDEYPREGEPTPFALYEETGPLPEEAIGMCFAMYAASAASA